jgi:membrane peptidoglycan carboxypeptidase
MKQRLSRLLSQVPNHFAVFEPWLLPARGVAPLIQVALAGLTTLAKRLSTLSREYVSSQALTTGRAALTDCMRRLVHLTRTSKPMTAPTIRRAIVLTLFVALVSTEYARRQINLAIRSKLMTAPAIRRAIVLTLFVALVSIVSLGVTGGAIYARYAAAFDAPSSVGINQPRSGARIYDRNGNLLYRFVDEREGLRQPIALSDASPNLIAATIAAEDSSFYDNTGVNTRGLIRAATENLNPFGGNFLGGSGGSSITQQLVKNVYFPVEERDDRTFQRKARETVYAIEMTKRYSKDQILEWYLNEISYGGVYSGAQAASEGYLGKSASQLTLAEAALLAGLPQAPSSFSPLSAPEAAVERRNQVLDIMLSAGTIKTGANNHFAVTPEEIEAAKVEPLRLAPQQSPMHAPHFVFSYIQPQLEALFGKDALYQDGLVVRTSLDINLVNAAGAALNRWLAAYGPASNTKNGSVVVMDPRTGEILAMLGSRNYADEAIQGENNNALALNSPGSAFKPLVYLASFIKLGWAPATAIDDAPLTHRNPDGSTFQPVNPGRNFRGNVSMRDALGNSLNVPAFKTAQAVGVNDIVAFGRKAGINTLQGSYGPAIAIGGADVTQLDLTHAYSLLAGGGMLSGQSPLANGDGPEPVALLQVSDQDGNIKFDIESRRARERVAPEAETFLVNDILRDANAQCQTFGCGGLAIPGHSAAVKTGTSEPFDPNGPNAGKIGETWAFGYTPDVVVSVWAGNSDNAPITNIQSTTIAFTAMRDVMLSYFKGGSATPFQPPSDVARARVCFPGGNQANAGDGCVSIEDWFVASRLPTVQHGDNPSNPVLTETPGIQQPRASSPLRNDRGGGNNNPNGNND